MNIYVSNLSVSVEADDLKKKFAPYGEVSLINIISDKFTNRSKGFAFVGMRNQAAAELLGQGDHADGDRGEDGTEWSHRAGDAMPACVLAGEQASCGGRGFIGPKRPGGCPV